jgi:peptide/nickel transport system permease protein
MTETAHENKAPDLTVAPERGRGSLLKDSFRAFRRNRLAVFGGIVIILIFLFAVFGPYITPYEYDEMSAQERFVPPTWRHPMGTDQFGRDTATRVIYGTQISVRVALLSVGISLAIGSLLGLISGYVGGRTDEVIMRAMDVILAFPAVLLALLFLATLGTSLTNVIWAIAIVRIPGFARVARSCALSIREEEYVLAARAIGAQNSRVIFRHVLPNSMAPLIVMATISLAIAILVEATLSFLGLGTQPPTPSWGRMLNDARGYMQRSAWMSVFPGFAIAITVFSLNVFGDGLRDALDPRLKF